jgi:hypothetical protein
VESLFVVTLLVIVASSGVAVAGEWRGRLRAQGAARLLRDQIRLARASALRDGVSVGLVFARSPGDELVFRLHRDGNANGVRRAEADRGVDPPVQEAVRLADWFAGTSLRIPAALPGIEDGAPVAAGSDPIRLSGGSSVLSCTPAGTVTAGTVFVAGARGEAFAVRTLGSTGRLRVFEFDPSTATWVGRW